MQQVQDPLERRAETPRPLADTLANDGNGLEPAPQQPSASAVTPHRRRQQAMVQLAVDEAAAAAASNDSNGPEPEPQQPLASAVTPHRRRQQAMVQLAVDSDTSAAGRAAARAAKRPTFRQ